MAADGLVLAVNSGSSSLKFGLFAERGGDEAVVLRGGADGIGQPDGKLRVEDGDGRVLLDESYASSSEAEGSAQAEALAECVRALLKFSHAAPAAVGHRVVHGGPRLREHQRITDELIRTLEAAVHFAPLHIPAAVELIRQTEKLLPEAAQFACFDTAFHSTMPESASMYALPKEIRRRGVQRYGFHGLSYESIVHRLGEKIPPCVVCAHLGSGASLVALHDGRSVDTSMGLTPTGGIPMGTRIGDLDPGVVIFLLRAGMTPDELETMFNRQSGLVAIAGESDMRQLLERMERGDREAALAIEIFVSSVRKLIGAYAAELGGLDLLVFTGGIGEHSALLRGRICERLEFLGVRRAERGEFSKVAVMASQEEAQIARHCRRLLRG
ncbi:MAG TPA: acetate/propionate family kinase [Silvibacterium sp.]|nr:acetate/propionate family kinase [Silvibacterium sp.]